MAVPWKSRLGVKIVNSYDAAGQVVKITYPDDSYSSYFYDGDRLIRQISRTDLTTIFAYDPLGRQVAVTNARVNSIHLSYDAVDNLVSETDPINYITSHFYDSMNRWSRTILSDGRVFSNSFDSLDRLIATTGAGSVPAFYSYDAIDRLTQLKDGEGNKTLFAYDSISRLTKKTYADNSFYSYGYNPRGWLTNRVDAMNRNTKYEYNNAGQITKINYPTDPDIICAMDNLGRTTQRVDAAGTWNWSYDGESSRVLSETLTSVSSVVSVVNYSYSSSTFDLSSMSFSVNGGPTNTVNYSWSNGRLTNISSALSATSAVNFAYSYLPNSDLISELTSDLGPLTSKTIRSYDSADRLLSVINSNNAGATLVSRFDYDYDNTGRRIRRIEADNSHIDYGYDRYDQLTSAAKTNSANAALDAAYKFLYQYDEVGNRLHEDRGLLDLDGTFNPLNQLTHLGFAGKLDIVGTVSGTNGPFSVKVDGETAALYNQTNFHGGSRVKPGSNTISIVSADAGTNRQESLRKVTFPSENPQKFTWDLNGNLANDGQRVYNWNEENRLIAVENVGAASMPRNKSEFKYDGQGRMFERNDFSGWANDVYTTTNTTRYIRNGYQIIAEIFHSDTPTLNYTNTYVWGLDLSQTLNGAGGVSGMLAAKLGTNSVVYCYDGNGNVSELINSVGGIDAHYEYDPFGRVVAKNGVMADINPWQFSTKQFDPIWSMVHYEYRPYSPNLHVFISRDPIKDVMISLYRYVDNDVINYIDTDGRYKYSVNGTISSFPSVNKSTTGSRGRKDPVPTHGHGRKNPPPHTNGKPVPNPNPEPRYPTVPVTLEAIWECKGTGIKVCLRPKYIPCYLLECPNKEGPADGFGKDDKAAWIAAWKSFDQNTKCDVGCITIPHLLLDVTCLPVDMRPKN